MIKMNFLLFALIVFISSPGLARQDTIQIGLNENFSNTIPEIRELLLLAVESELNDPILEFEIENTTDQSFSNLFIEISISSEEQGQLLRVTQNDSYPISLNENSDIRFTNKDIIDQTFPGSTVTPQFNFLLLERGRRLLNTIENNQLPTGAPYQISVSIFEDGNREANGSLVGSRTFTLGAGALADHSTIEADEESLELLANLDISRERPLFKWNSSPYKTYRLVVVEDTPENNTELLLQHSFNQANSDFIRTDLADFEYLDVNITGNSYAYTESMLKQLEYGKTYAWQVRTTIHTPTGEEEVQSDIWRFSLNTPIDGEVRELLTILFGEERVSQMVESGLQLNEIEIGGVTLSDRDAVEYLTQLAEKIRNNRVVITH